MEFMIEKGDKIMKMLLLSPHEADFLYKKEDGTFYTCHHRKGGDTYSIPEIQLELFPPEPPKKQKVAQDKPHHNILERHYGKDWTPKENKDLAPHF